MDFTSLGFYAAVCGILSVLAPNLGPPFLRLAIGAVVGIVAALVLPMVKGMIGGY